MITIFSSSFMYFVDRVYLARYSVEAMNALAIGGIWSFFLLVIPLSICEITEVFVGKYNGAGKKREAAFPVWQMLWTCLFLWPVFSILSRLIAHYIFGTDSQEAIYLVTYLNFAPIQLATIAISGFFIATGRVKVITYATIGANLLNLALAPLFIFTLELGIQGAAYASGLSMTFLAACLSWTFLKSENRAHYNTDACSFKPILWKEMLSVAGPSGLGRAIEVFAHCAFFAIMASAGFETLTAVTFVQSFYLLCCFLIDATAKGSTAVLSNLIGAKAEIHVQSALKSALTLHSMIALVVALFGYFSVDWLLQLTIGPQDTQLLANPDFIWSLRTAMLWMSLFFLFDGFAWIFAGQLTARSDTTFLLWVSLVANWLTYLLPIFVLIHYLEFQSAALAWAIIALNSIVMCTLYALRTKRYLPIAAT